MTTSRATGRLRLTKKRLVIGAISLLVISVALASYYFWSTRPLIERRIIDQADFPVYAPQQAPSGYRLNSDKTQVTDTVLTYVFTDQSNNADITVSVQAKPATFDMSQLTKGGSITSTAVKSGTLYNLSAGGTSQYLLDSGDALIFLTSPANISTEKVNSLANSLAKQN